MRSHSKPRICLIATELFAWGKHGGFGRAARTIGRALVQRGFEVRAVVPRRRGQRAVERLDGMAVLSFPASRPWEAVELFRRCNADVYHSCEISMSSWIAQRAMPDRRHMVTFRDPRDIRDWLLELHRPSLSRWQVLLNFAYESGPLARAAVGQMDAIYTIGHNLIPKVHRMYRPKIEPRFLPTPVRVPTHVTKATEPTVCWLARLDRRKRPELFFDLVRQFPGVRFIAAGKSRDPSWEASLRHRYGHLPNLEMPGFVDQFRSSEHGKILESSWILVNSATRESMPNSYLEAAAHGCAILSRVDADGFASRFGYCAAQDDFAQGLRYLLENDRWREGGRLARAHVNRTFELDRAMDLHIDAYYRLAGADRAEGSRAVA